MTNIAKWTHYEFLTVGFISLLSLLAPQLSFWAVLAAQFNSPFFSFPTSGYWNDLIPVALLVLATLYAWFIWKKIHLNTRVVQTSALATALLFFASGATSYDVINEHALLLYLAVIWSLPLLAHLLKHAQAHLFLLATVALLVLQSQWGVAQFIAQRDLGFQLIGESILGPDVSGVAKFTAHDAKLIRAYGPYPHANSFAGSMLIGLLLITPLAASALVHKPDSATRLFFYSVVFVLMLGILLSFSRVAYLGLALWGVSFVAPRRKTQRTSLYQSLVLLLLVLVFIFLPLLTARTADAEDKALSERFRGSVWAVGIIGNQGFIQGSGPGNYVRSLEQYLASQRLSPHPWEIQPVHSVPFLLVAEFGVLSGLLLIALLLYQLIRAHSLGMFAPIVPALLLDHYLYTQIVPLILFLILVLAGKYLVYTGEIVWRGRQP